MSSARRVSVQTDGMGALRADGCRSFAPGRALVTADRILRVQGYAPSRRIPPALQNAAESTAEILARIAAPQACYRRFDTRALDEDGTLHLADGIRFQCEAFNAYLGDCRSVVLFVLTLGSGLDLIERNLIASGNLMEAVLLESAAWMAIEHATKKLARHIAAEMESEGLSPTRRMAPGYEFRVGGRKLSWPLEQHSQFFAAFGPDPLPVELLESCAMTPKMSRSGLWGFRPRPA